MKFLILSDLHLEFGAPYVPPLNVAYDAVVLAGDITSRGGAVGWAASLFGTDVPIIVVSGNHEYYNGELQSLRHQFQVDAEAFSNVHVLDPGEALLDGGRIRVLGCTLWTDFEMPILTREGPVVHREGAIEEAWRLLNDYRLIWFCPPSMSERPFEPHDSLDLHRIERAWLLAKLQAPFDGSTVVVTHHGPSSGSVTERWAKHWLTPAFSSHLPDEYFVAPALWIHGHTHSSRDYVRGNTRVVCNPRGYPARNRGFENKEFDGELVIEVTST